MLHNDDFGVFSYYQIDESMWTLLAILGESLFLKELLEKLSKQCWHSQ